MNVGVENRLWPAGHRATGIIGLLLWNFTGLCNHSFRVARYQELKGTVVVSNWVAIFFLHFSACVPNELFRFHCLPGLVLNAYFLADAGSSVPSFGISNLIVFIPLKHLS